MHDDIHHPRRFGLVLVPGFSHLGLTLVTEPLFVANWIARRGLFDCITLSVDGLAVRSSSGAALAVQAPLGDPAGLDTVLVIASFEADVAARDRVLLNWLRRCARMGIGLGAVETGGEVLAAAGLLEDCSVPVHWYMIEGFRERYPAIAATPTLFDLGAGRLLSAGALATLDMMLALIARHAGPALAGEVARHLLLAMPRNGSEPQPGEAAHCAPAPEDAVARAQEVMRLHVAEPLSCNAVAARVGVSQRQLQRLFRRRLGTGMQRSYRLIRLERAHQLVQQTDLSLTEIALACGFGALESFSRTYRATFGVPPSRDRAQSTAASVYSRTLLEAGAGARGVAKRAPGPARGA